MPNEQALQTKSVQSLIVPYGNLFGLNSHWRFFSPGPTPAIFMEYQPYFDDYLSSDEDSKVYLFPQRKEGYSYSSTYIRRMYTLRFYGFNRIALENYFAPYLCRQHQGATAIRMETFTYVIPSLLSDQEVEDFREDAFKKPIERITLDCPQVSRSSVPDQASEEEIDDDNSEEEGGFLEESDYSQEGDSE